MSTDDDTPSFDAALRAHLQAGGEPGDAGFSLRMMAALPPAVSWPQRRRAGWVRRAQWLAISLAACGLAVLLQGGPLDAPRAVAAASLAGLLAFWVIPSRWSR